MPNRVCGAYHLQEYAADRIYMNSVDTGWINDENPAHIAERLAAEHGEHGFATPLDEVDAAARVLDPVFTGVAEGNTASGARPAFSTPLVSRVLSTFSRAATCMLRSVGCWAPQGCF